MSVTGIWIGDRNVADSGTVGAVLIEGEGGIVNDRGIVYVNEVIEIDGDGGGVY